MCSVCCHVFIFLHILRMVLAYCINPLLPQQFYSIRLSCLSPWGPPNCMYLDTSLNYVICRKTGIFRALTCTEKQLMDYWRLELFYPGGGSSRFFCNIAKLHGVTYLMTAVFIHELFLAPGSNILFWKSKIILFKFIHLKVIARYISCDGAMWYNLMNFVCNIVEYLNWNGLLIRGHFCAYVCMSPV